MSKLNMIEKCEQTKITWKDGQDPTRKKVKKKRNGKRVTVDIASPSFFKFFDQMRMPEDEDLKMGKLIVRRSDLEYPSKVAKEEVEEKTEDEEDTEP